MLWRGTQRITDLLEPGSWHIEWAQVSVQWFLFHGFRVQHHYSTGKVRDVRFHWKARHIMWQRVRVGLEVWAIFFQSTVSWGVQEFGPAGLHHCHWAWSNHAPWSSQVLFLLVEGDHFVEQATISKHDVQYIWQWLSLFLCLFVCLLVCLLVGWFGRSVGRSVGRLVVGMVCFALLCFVGLSLKYSRPTRGAGDGSRQNCLWTRGKTLSLD